MTIERLSEYLDRMLPQAEAAEIEAHLAACAACKAELADLRRTLDAVKALPRVRAPRGFAAGVMAEIRHEAAAPMAVPTRVTPIRSAAVFMRLVASIAAICLVWVGVRALRVDPAERPATGIEAQAGTFKGNGESGESARLKKSGTTAGIESKGKAQDPDLAAAKENLDAAGAGSTVRPAPAAPKDAAIPPVADALKGAADEPRKAAWGDEPGESAQALAVQRITVYSNDIAVDTSQLKQLLGESGYTWSTQKKAILVRVPASEASRLVASLGSMPGGFRAGDRKSLESLERLKKEQPQKAQDDKNGEPRNAERGLTADADDLEATLRQHIDETKKQIRKQEEGKKAKAPASDPKAPGVAAASGGGAGGKSREGASKAGQGAKTEGVRDGSEQYESEEGVAAGADPGHAPAGPAEMGGGRPEAEKNKAHREDGERGATLRDKNKDLGDAKGDAGGTDDVEGRARREKEVDEQLSDELRKLEAGRKTADAEDAVVIYIEFESPIGNPVPTKDDPDPSRK